MWDWGEGWNYWVRLWQVYGGVIRVARAGTLGWSTVEGKRAVRPSKEMLALAQGVVVVRMLRGWGRQNAGGRRKAWS